MWNITFQSFSKNIGKSYKLKESLLEQELEHDEIYEDKWEDKENEWLPYLKLTCYQLLSVMVDVQKKWKN